MVVACVVLGLSIWAFMTRCTDKFGDVNKNCPVINLDGCAQYGPDYSLDNCNGTPVNLGNEGKYCCPVINLDGCAKYGPDYSLDNCNGTPVNLGNAGKYCCQ